LRRRIRQRRGRGENLIWGISRPRIERGEKKARSLILLNPEAS